jgi:hypothetical protein
VLDFFGHGHRRRHRAQQPTCHEDVCRMHSPVWAKASWSAPIRGRGAAPMAGARRARSNVSSYLGRLAEVVAHASKSMHGRLAPREPSGSPCMLGVFIGTAPFARLGSCHRPTRTDASRSSLTQCSHLLPTCEASPMAPVPILGTVGRIIMLAFTILFTLALTFLEILVWMAAEHPGSPSSVSPRARIGILRDALRRTLGTFSRLEKRAFAVRARR